MTIKSALKSASGKLNSAKIKLPHLEAEILLSAILNKPREFFYAYGETNLTSAQVAKFNSSISRRLKGDPAAYITGHKEFYGFDFLVNKNVLIPRPETELIIDESLKLLAQKPRPTTIIDVGTGSGCLAITLAKLTGNAIMAADISVKALAVARRNAKVHGARVVFRRGDLLAPFLKSLSDKGGRILILANLPYLTAEQIKACPDLKFEPRTALSGGARGLKLYRRLFQQAATAKISADFICELDPSQAGAINKIVRQYFPKAKIQIKKDLRGLNRLAVFSVRP